MSIYHCSAEFVQRNFQRLHNIQPHVPDRQEFYMQTVNPEVKEIFQDSDFEKTLKTLATEFGETTTLKQINYWLEQNREMPERLVNNKKYVAGYRGSKMVSEGDHKGTLIEIKQNGTQCKLMFDIDKGNVFLYHNFPRENLKVEQIVSLAQNVGNVFNVIVKHETIPQTGDKHAVVSEVVGLEEVLGS